MTMSNGNRENAGETFEYVWKIENFDACRKRTPNDLLSPTFVSETLAGSSWCLVLAINGKGHDGGVGICLLRDGNCRCDGDVVVECEISILKAGKFDCEYVMEKKFEKSANIGYGKLKFVELSKLLEQKSTFLPNNTLTVRCLIRLTQEKESRLEAISSESATSCICGNVFRNNHFKLTGVTTFTRREKELKKRLNPPVDSCTATSRIGVERVYIEWSSAKFSDWEADQEHTFPVTSAVDRFTYLMLTLSLDKDESVRITIFKKENSLDKFSSVSCKVSVLGIAGEFEKSVEKEFHLEKSKTQTFLHETPFAKDAILAALSVSPNVRFSFEFAFSEGKIVSNSIRSSTFLPRKETIFRTDAETPGMENLKRVFVDQKYTDVTFRIGEEAVRAHRSILSSRSPVFDRMFSVEMRERKTRVVDIDGIDSQTFKTMLMFMYSETVAEDLDVEMATRLYAASDKYEFVMLMRKCAQFLVQNLDVDNACAILSLADDHNDRFLKSSAIDFVCAHANIILCSDEWKTLVGWKGPLASEALHKISIGLTR